jgi:hypothetical protein
MIYEVVLRYSKSYLPCIPKCFSDQIAVYNGDGSDARILGTTPTTGSIASLKFQNKRKSR